MTPPDFSDIVNKFRLPRWFVLKVGRSRSHCFAIEFTLGLVNKAGRAPIARSNSVRRWWAFRVKELLSRRLWFLDLSGVVRPDDPDFNLERFASSYRRTVCCRPAYLFYRSFNREKLINYQRRPCWRSHFCPFCFASVSGTLFRSVKSKLNKLLTESGGRTSLVLSSRITSQFVPAADFDSFLGCGPDGVHRLVPQLKAALQEHRKAHESLSRLKHFTRKTSGALWRVIVVPQEKGWVVETRQVLLHESDQKKLPWVRVKGAKIVEKHRVRVSRRGKNGSDKFDEQVYYLLGSFCRYPKELLLCPVELTATYLWAIHGMRLVSGAGLFRRAGRTLVQYYKSLASAKREKRLAENEEKEEPAPEEPPPTQDHLCD